MTREEAGKPRKIIVDCVKLKKLVATARNMHRKNVPTCFWCEESNSQSGHWSSTLDEIKSAIDRRLTEEEITVFSLSRCYGPTPLLTEVDRDELLRYLWPQGNGSGSWYETYENLADVLDRLLPNR